jgi:DNA-binding FadR family transcriptional regulator
MDALAPAVGTPEGENRDGDAIKELPDFRRMVEPAAAARAARNASQEDIIVVEEILARQASQVRNRNRADVEDAEFHWAVANASKNGFCRRFSPL